MAGSLLRGTCLSPNFNTELKTLSTFSALSTPLQLVAVKFKKFGYTAPHHTHTHTTPLLPSAKFKRITLLCQKCFFCFGSCAGHRGNSMTRMDPENHLSSLTAEKNNNNNNNNRRPVWTSVLKFIWHSLPSVIVNGCVINANYVALVLYIFFFFLCIILSLHVGCFTILQRVLFSQWPYSILFYSMHKTVSCVFIDDFTFVVDTTKRMSILLYPPLAFPATVMMMMMMMNLWASIFHFLLLLFCYKALQYYGIEKKKINIQEALLYGVATLKIQVKQSTHPDS